MLLELHVKNFALIDRVDLEFAEGLNILTGETGAGKSIIIDSVNFLLGDKQSKDIIRTGEESAYVEGVFEVRNEEFNRLLLENGIETDEVVVITREINQSGRSISRINGRTVTVGLLKQAGKYLIDIHGQHEHQSLLDEDSHMDILDSFCGESFQALKKEYRQKYADLKEIKRELNKLNADEQYKLRRMDLLSFQIQEISEANLKIGEDEELAKRKDILANSEKIISNLAAAYESLYEGEEKGCAYDLMGVGISHLESIEKYDENLSKMKTSLEDLYYQLKDIIDEIREYRDSIDFDPEELNDIEARLDLINRLKRKYGSTIEEILQYYDKIKEELSKIERSEEIIEDMNKKKDEYLKNLREIAAQMTEIRKKTALRLKEAIEKELKYLGMERAIFKVEVKEREELGENGNDNVYFTMTANPGEPLRPLSKVASGGEMSRIMLAIKSVIADVDRIPTLIFDEIDTGISGRTAQSVAEKMVLIAKNHQILCVTHLPQIASMADVHFKIQKFINNDKTVTTVQKLEYIDQVDELARMLGGAIVTELTRNHSKEMLELARDLKYKIRN
ncbi:DNA repair protein RecN [Fonticella tunisiensis]|uniref:DNA repair protein RecN n=1 Tax=Fonticella tunisiensis TaxID=1096341 RepID=A0A4R7KRC7_9CLOT|nr:DNA repair protein RecN [Fonticella tunisiensis]TDT61932.1 DNA replication and repair protein RecN [Fonticella tunisiensis]